MLLQYCPPDPYRCLDVCYRHLGEHCCLIKRHPLPFHHPLINKFQHLVCYNVTDLSSKCQRKFSFAATPASYHRRVGARGRKANTQSDSMLLSENLFSRATYCTMFHVPDTSQTRYRSFALRRVLNSDDTACAAPSSPCPVSW